MKGPIQNEMDRLGIETGPGMGYFVLDFSVYNFYGAYPIDMGASLSSEPMAHGIVYDLREGAVLNHRYPNHRYTTLSQKFGRKTCKVGCIFMQPHQVFVDIHYLNLFVRFEQGQYIMYASVPIHMMTSDEFPCVDIEVRIDIQNPVEPALTIYHAREMPQIVGRYLHSYGTKNTDKRSINHIKLTPEGTGEFQPNGTVYGPVMELPGSKLV